jgi:hypothetical protein
MTKSKYQIWHLGFDIWILFGIWIFPFDFPQFSRMIFLDTIINGDIVSVVILLY